MAAIMAAGMVPPLAVFVATVLFKDKFTQEERDSGLTNIVMGLSFITEVPFHSVQLTQLVPSLASLLVQHWQVPLLVLQAWNHGSHGGIFVIALTSNPLLYILFVLIGAVVSGILFGLLRKPKTKPIYRLGTSRPFLYSKHQLVIVANLYRFRYDSKHFSGDQWEKEEIPHLGIIVIALSGVAIICSKYPNLFSINSHQVKQASPKEQQLEEVKKHAERNWRFCEIF